MKSCWMFLFLMVFSWSGAQAKGSKEKRIKEANKVCKTSEMKKLLNELQKRGQFAERRCSTKFLMVKSKKVKGRRLYSLYRCRSKDECEVMTRYGVAENFRSNQLTDNGLMKSLNNKNCRKKKNLSQDCRNYQRFNNSFPILSFDQDAICDGSGQCTEIVKAQYEMTNTPEVFLKGMKAYQKKDLVPRRSKWWGLGKKSGKEYKREMINYCWFNRQIKRVKKKWISPFYITYVRKDGLLCADHISGTAPVLSSNRGVSLPSFILGQENALLKNIENGLNSVATELSKATTREIRDALGELD